MGGGVGDLPQFGVVDLGRAHEGDDGNPPSGCRIERRDHASRYKTGTGWHYWIDPGDELRKARMPKSPMCRMPAVVRMPPPTL